MPKGQRYNPFDKFEFATLWPNGLPQFTSVNGVQRRNWETPRKGKASTLNPKRPTRYLFAGMWKTPKGVGYYGGNKRMPDGEWMIRVRWDERDASAGHMDFPLRRLQKNGTWIEFIKPIFKAPKGGVIKPVWREEGHMKTKGKPMPKFILEEVEAEPGPPALDLRVTHSTHGPGTVVGISHELSTWYAEVRYDNQAPRRDTSPYGPLLEDKTHEYASASFYGRFFDVKRPKTKRSLRARKTKPENQSIRIVLPDEDLTEFVIGNDGRPRRRTVGSKIRARPNGDFGPSPFLREAGIGTEWD